MPNETIPPNPSLVKEGSARRDLTTNPRLAAIVGKALVPHILRVVAAAILNPSEGDATDEERAWVARVDPIILEHVRRSLGPGWMMRLRTGYCPLDYSVFMAYHLLGPIVHYPHVTVTMAVVEFMDTLARLEMVVPPNDGPFYEVICEFREMIAASKDVLTKEQQEEFLGITSRMIGEAQRFGLYEGYDDLLVKYTENASR